MLGQEINEVFASDLEKFSGDCSGCQRETFYTVLEHDTELKSTSESSDKEKSYTLSDGNIITAGADCFRCAEMLLQPSFIGKEASGIHDASSVLYDGVAIFQGMCEHTGKDCNVR